MDCSFILDKANEHNLIKYLLYFQNNNNELPYHVINNKEFTNMVENIIDIDDYRLIVNKLSYYHDVSNIEKRRKKIYNDMVEKFDYQTKLIGIYKYLWVNIIIRGTSHEKYEQYLKENNLKELYTNINAIIKEASTEYDKQNYLLKYFQKLSRSYLQQIIVDSPLQDIIYNSIADIKQVLSFENQIGISLIKDNIRSIYQKIANIDKLGNDELLSLYYQVKDIDLSTILYDNIRKSKNISYTLIKKSLISKEKLHKNLNKKLSDEKKVKIYELKGEPFYALVHATKYEKAIISNLSKSSVLSNVPTISYSLIDGSHLNIYRSPRNYIVYGYDDFCIDNVVHVYHDDSYSDYDTYTGITTTDRVNELYTPYMLMKQTKYQYNEIIIKSKINEINPQLSRYIKMNPNYLLCYDSVTNDDINYAKKNNLYIVLIYTDYYQDNTNYIEKDLKYITYNSYDYQKKRLDKYSRILS